MQSESHLNSTSLKYPAPHYQPIERKKRKGKNLKIKMERAAYTYKKKYLPGS